MSQSGWVWLPALLITSAALGWLGVAAYARNGPRGIFRIILVIMLGAAITCAVADAKHGADGLAEFFLGSIPAALGVGAWSVAILWLAPQRVRPRDVALAALAFFAGAGAFWWPSALSALIERIRG